jgi:cell division protein FtsI/penicillin-binding protein 2
LCLFPDGYADNPTLNIFLFCSVLGVDHHIPAKANRVLNVILLCFLLILVRVWVLSVVNYEERLQKARSPKRRTVVEQVERATIRDRFNEPLAMNKIDYRVAICYAPMRNIPSSSWSLDEQGKKVRTNKRAHYIGEFSKMLGAELQMDPLEIEDTIHAKAALFPNTPFVLKEGISETQYYKLRMMEREWLGLQTERGSKRVYPRGRVGSDVIGYIGTMSEKNYYKIAEETKSLKEYLALREAGELPCLPKGFSSPIEVRKRLKELEEKAYTVNATVGRAGIEAMFDEKLRGSYGKKMVEIDTKGNRVRLLPGGREKVAGQRIFLSISAELQEYAEALLAQTEDSERMNMTENKPWIKGGAIVAMIPQTGEVLALASYPRFDPNDFVPVLDPALKKKKQPALTRWLETESYIGEIWDGKRELEKEFYEGTQRRFFEQPFSFSWENYLDSTLSPKSQLRHTMEKITTVRTACAVQQLMFALLNASGQQEMSALVQTLYADKEHIASRSPISLSQRQVIAEKLKEGGEAVREMRSQIGPLLSSITRNDDKLLFLDLCRLAVSKEDFPDALLRTSLGETPLSRYRELCQGAAMLHEQVKRETKHLFHTTDFKKWRELQFKDLLRKLRKEEQRQHRYSRPYTDYLDQIEREQFREFWKMHKWELLLDALKNERYTKHALVDALRAELGPLSPQLALDYLKTMRPFEELNRTLWGRYPNVRNNKGVQLEKHLAAAFYPSSGYGYGRSQAFRQSTPQGSVFKLMTSYAALNQQLAQGISDLNPLTMIDDMKGSKRDNSRDLVLGTTLSGQPYRRLYKEGLLPRATHSGVGRIDIVGALEQSSNIYFSLLAGDFLHDPTHLSDTARLFGFGALTGIDLPGEIRGNVPDDISHNKTGLYSFAIGQHTLVVTPLQTALMMSAIGNGGHLLKPKIVSAIVGKEVSSEIDALFSQEEFPFKEELSSIGLHFPFFTQAGKRATRTAINYAESELRRTLFLPAPIREVLLEGMTRVVMGARGSARPAVVRRVTHPSALRDYNELQRQLIGKTGTAQILYKKWIDAESSANLETHIWFSALSFPHDLPADGAPAHWPDPELAVVVYLRYAGAGKEGAPIAAQMVKKWRDIQAKKR